MFFVAEYTHLKSLVSKNNQHHQRVSGVVLQPAAPVTVVAPTSSNSMHSEVNGVNGFNNVVTGSCNGNPASVAFPGILMRQVPPGVNNQQGGATNDSVQPVKKRRGRKRKYPLPETDGNVVNGPGGKNPNLPLSNPVSEGQAPSQATFFYIQSKNEQVWVPITTASGNNANKNDSCHQSEVSNSSASTVTSSQAGPTELSGLDLLAAVSSVLKTSKSASSNVPAAGSPVDITSTSEENPQQDDPQSKTPSNELQKENDQDPRCQQQQQHLDEQDQFVGNHHSPNEFQLLHQQNVQLQSPLCTRLSCSATAHEAQEEYSILVTHPEHEIVI